MGAKLKDLGDAEILRVIRASVTSSAGVYNEVEIDTQLSIERGVIWLIHFVEFSSPAGALNLTEIAAQGNENVEMHVARETKGAMVNINDSDCIQYWRKELYRSVAIGTDVGPLWEYDMAPFKFNFPVPLPYASQSIYFGIKSTKAGPPFGYCRIGFSIRTVSDKYFFRVAQSLLG